jgi:hypothetical protein
MSPPVTKTTYKPSKEVIKALRFLLYPLIKLMLSYQITYPFVIKLLKEIYVEVAEQEYKIKGKRQTDSRISLISGVHRKDVKVLRGSTFNYEDDLPVGITLGSQLVARWCAEDKYLDKKENPRPLPRLSNKSSQKNNKKERSSFESLVRSINKDIRPRSVLDELLRLNIVHICANDNVWLHKDALVADKGLVERAIYLGLNLHDHIAVCSHNMLGGKPSMLERCLHYDNLTADDVKKLAIRSREMGMEMLQTLNQEAFELQQKSKGKEGADKRMNYGIYFMRGEMSDFDFEETDTTDKD